MQQAFKTVMEQMNTQNNQFANAGFSPNSPFAHASPPAASTSTSPPLAASQATTVDVSATRVEEPPATDIKDDSEYEQQPKKYGNNYISLNSAVYLMHGMCPLPMPVQKILVHLPIHYMKNACFPCQQSASSAIAK